MSWSSTWWVHSSSRTHCVTLDKWYSSSACSYFSFLSASSPAIYQWKNTYWRLCFEELHLRCTLQFFLKNLYTLHTSYNLFTSRPEVIANTSAAEVSELLTASSRNSFSGDVLGWHLNIPDVVTRIMPSTVCDTPEELSWGGELSKSSSLITLSTISECWNMATSFSPGGSVNVWIILDSVFCRKIPKWIRF